MKLFERQKQKREYGETYLLTRCNRAINATTNLYKADIIYMHLLIYTYVWRGFISYGKNLC